MPSVRQPMVQYTPPADPSSAGLSRSNFSRLQAMFPNSPIYSLEIDDAERRKTYKNIALAGDVNDGGSAFGTPVNMDYANAPDLANVNISNTPAGANLPTPYYPNPGAPAGVDASTITPITQNTGYGVGPGSQLSPKQSAQRISGQAINNMNMGTSLPEPESAAPATPST